MITAQQFAQAFDQISREHMPILLEHWWPPSSFTPIIKEQKVMPAIANTLECSMHLEHGFRSQRVDVVFNEHIAPNKVAVAVEHENNFKHTHEEVTKLRDFNAPLGVLITYARKAWYQDLFSQYDSIMASDKSLSGTSLRGELLVIFGPYGSNPPKVLTWDYFVYRDNEFQKMSI